MCFHSLSYVTFSSSNWKETSFIHSNQRENCTFWVVFTCLPKIYDWVTGPSTSKSKRSDDQDYVIDKDSWSIKIDDISPDYHEKLEKLKIEGFTLPCLHSKGKCTPTLKHPYTFVCFP